MSRSDGSTADYYVLPEAATQLQDLISHRDMNSQIGEIFRACYRYGIVSHSDKMRDAKKIRFYAQAEVERLEKLGAAQNTGGPIAASATYIVGEQPSEFLVPSHIISDIPAGEGLSWDGSPEWANWIATDVEGAHWYECEPEMTKRGGDNWDYPLHSKYDTIHENPSKVAKYPRPARTAQ